MRLCISLQHPEEELRPPFTASSHWRVIPLSPVPVCHTRPPAAGATQEETSQCWTNCSTGAEEHFWFPNHTFSKSTEFQIIYMISNKTFKLNFTMTNQSIVLLIMYTFWLLLFVLICKSLWTKAHAKWQCKSCNNSVNSMCHCLWNVVMVLNKNRSPQHWHINSSHGLLSLLQCRWMLVTLFQWVVNYSFWKRLKDLRMMQQA